MSLDRRSRFKVDRNDFVESSYFADDNNTQDNVEQDRITSVTNTLFREVCCLFMMIICLVISYKGRSPQF